ncbi:unnamed protein product [Prorocentrum cordatum]|uniref:Uncharacterized protein n=1 Tax=Prorocentrum cordatum TaxID=2364126 RepID=A0ABN9V8G3_9DINO|nr:unnamed protein product [Polarella glacialis]
MACASSTEKGIQVWPPADVMGFTGANDALVRVARVGVGCEGTPSLYRPADSAAGFGGALACRPRAIQRGRGASGDGIWIVALKAGCCCCFARGERSCAHGEALDFMEASDSHAEEHAVAGLGECCASGRTAASGAWTWERAGKYLEAGKEAGGMLMDQRSHLDIFQRCVEVCDGGRAARLGAGASQGVGRPLGGGAEARFMGLTAIFPTKDFGRVVPSNGLVEELAPLRTLAGSAARRAADCVLVAGLGSAARPASQKRHFRAALRARFRGLADPLQRSVDSMRCFRARARCLCPPRLALMCYR